MDEMTRLGMDRSKRFSSCMASKEQPVLRRQLTRGQMTGISETNCRDGCLPSRVSAR